MFKYLLLLSTLVCFALTLDLQHSDITTVTEETRYTTKNPGVKLTPFKKSHHVKGNYVFTAGERITGDRLILTYLDETQFTKSENIEVLLKYPAKGKDGATLTSIEIYVDLSSDIADAYFTQGGIDQTYAEILLVCDKTLHYTYEIFIYGY